MKGHRKKSLTRWATLSWRCNTPQHYGYFISKHKKWALKQEINIFTDYLSDRNCPLSYINTKKAFKIKITIEKIMPPKER